MNILLVEDNPFVAKDIIEKLKLIGYQNVVSSESYKQAINSLNTTLPDIAIVDIDLGEEKNGIDVGKVLMEKQIPFIYLSDMQDPKTFEQAKQTNPKANIDKPVSTITLRNCLDLAISSNKDSNKTGKYIVVPSGSKKIKINPESIIYLRAAKNNCEIHLVDEKIKRYLSSTPMGNVLQILNQEHFCQVHRSYVVNLKRVYAFQGSRVFMDRELKIEIPISPSHLTQFKSQFSAI
jgi:DNA-binding LytR/AlgR family response regulator